MNDNTQEKQAWEKGGPSPNPHGRPKGAKNFTTKVKEALMVLSEDGHQTKEALLVNKVLEKAIVDGDTQMLKLMWNYFDGMPTQKIEAEVDNKDSSLTEEQKQQLLKMIQ